MKKKINSKNNSSDELATKGYLDARLDANLEATKEYMDARFSHFKEEFGHEMNEKMRGQTVTILRAVDKVLVRFDSSEKNAAAGVLLHKRVTDQVDDHEKRIKKLEVAR